MYKVAESTARLGAWEACATPHATAEAAPRNLHRSSLDQVSWSAMPCGEHLDRGEPHALRGPHRPVVAARNAHVGPELAATGGLGHGSSLIDDAAGEGPVPSPIPSRSRLSPGRVPQPGGYPKVRPPAALPGPRKEGSRDGPPWAARWAPDRRPRTRTRWPSRGRAFQARGRSRSDGRVEPPDESTGSEFPGMDLWAPNSRNVLRTPKYSCESEADPHATACRGLPELFTILVGRSTPKPGRGQGR